MLGVASSASGAHSVGRIKSCVFITYDDAVPSANVKVAVNGAPHAKGTFAFTGAGMHQAIPFRLSSAGIGLTSFPVLQSGTVTITIKLATTPARAARPGGKVDAASKVTQPACTPK
jgi:hypothetical protein